MNTLAELRRARRRKISWLKAQGAGERNDHKKRRKFERSFLKISTQLYATRAPSWTEHLVAKSMMKERSCNTILRPELSTWCERLTEYSMSATLMTLGCF